MCTPPPQSQTAILKLTNKLSNNTEYFYQLPGVNGDIYFGFNINRVFTLKKEK